MARRYIPTGRAPGRPPKQRGKPLPPPPPRPISPELEAAALAADMTGRAAIDREVQDDEIERLLIEGADVRAINRILRTRWPMSIRTVQDRVREIWKRVREERKSDREDQRTTMVERLHRMRQKALYDEKKPDYDAALRAEQQIAKLLGLYEPKQVTVTGMHQHQHAHVHALAAVVAGLDDTQVEQLLAEQQEQEQLAEQARTLLPALAPSPPQSTDTRVSVAEEPAASRRA